MAKYTCRKCGASFKSFDPLKLMPVCERCKREKVQLKEIKGKNISSTDSTSGSSKPELTLGGCLFTIVIFSLPFIGWFGYKGYVGLTYWDAVFLRNNHKTYESIDFQGKSKAVSYINEDYTMYDVPVYHKETGEQKSITLKLPLIKRWTREQSKEDLNGNKIVKAYISSGLSSGYKYIKPSDAILEDSETFIRVLNYEKAKYKKAHYKEFGNWSYEKREK